jgi:polyisoprenyl-phosphate glycosyltransferase
MRESERSTAPVRLAIVVPCYNEEEVLPETSRRLLALVTRLQAAALVSRQSGIYFVDDGSRDRTWSLIESLCATDPRVIGIKLSRNRGHQNALLAGLFAAEGDAVVSVDADLQDDIEVIEQMVVRYREGSDLVFGVRRSRETDTPFKRKTALLYYRLLRVIGVDVIVDHADFRLLSRRAIDALSAYGEVNLFLRGIIPLLGFPAATVHYDRRERFAGVSKYPLRRMLGLAIDGVTSFSVVPLRIVTALGFVVCVLSIAMIAWVVYGAFVTNATVPGWASTVMPVYLLGGIQLLALGILGEYVAKIYLETKRRPRYVIERIARAEPSLRAADDDAPAHARAWARSDATSQVPR